MLWEWGPFIHARLVAIVQFCVSIHEIIFTFSANELGYIHIVRSYKEYVQYTIIIHTCKYNIYMYI